MTEYIYLTISFVALYFSYLFTLIENAYLTLSPAKISKLEDLEIENLSIIKKLVEKENIFSSMLILDYFCNSLVVIFMSLFFFNKWNYLGIIIGIIISTIIVILFGESLPRTLGKNNYEKIVPKYAKFLQFLIIFIRPLSMFITFLSQNIIKIATKEKTYKDSIITEDDLIDAMDLGIEEGIINKNESIMIQNVIGFKDNYAKDIMTPRTDIIAIDIEDDYAEIFEKISEYSYSRMPVYEDSLDNIIGILNVKDIFRMDKSKTLSENKDYFKKPFFTFQYKPTGKLFNEMRQNKLSVAIVTDEYGGTEGMITFEDIIEKIVGQISDEYDTEEDQDIVKVAQDKYLIDGSVNIDEINIRLGTELKCHEFDSVGGFIIEKLDRFPKPNEVIEIDNLKFTIMKSKKNRIEKILLELQNK
ncbi:hemolysin family protein [Peptoniphilus rhinitidis]|uniref:hemolysin family protein n=1 Tax=Peptoniphilus rhinitidis TaxID=1175452 RepID=UPI00028A3C69|nr:hemolysin family protein [Peptoniphilus rhinitidis]MDU1043837.1 hemolysin family protein [Peptoniphilus rhinitidis]MDU3751021.1 hemolysin family protein [Peptoniphilus rhinitidis]MDU5595559.1 hemolysin family protein [Peptoniphilus rhinitidis]